MRDPDRHLDDSPDRPTEPDVLFEPPSTRRGRRRWGRGRGRKVEPAVIAAVALVLFIGVGAWLWLRDGDDGTEGVTEPVEMAEGTPPAAGSSEGATATSADPPMELPPLDASDGFVRDVVAGLSTRPRWASWLVTDDLVRRFVGAVVRIAGGASPASQLDFLAPGGEFRVRQTEGGAVVDPAGYRRYDALATTFASLDTDGAARLYRRLQPLFEEAHRELGFAEDTFEDVFARAVRNVLAVDLQALEGQAGPVEVEWDEDVYVYRDPDLEALSPAEKHLLRMGPENARRVQAKLGEIATALGIVPG